MGVFLSNKLMKSWYFLGIFEFFMIFQDLGNMVFRAVKIEAELDLSNFATKTDLKINTSYFVKKN